MVRLKLEPRSKDPVDQHDGRTVVALPPVRRGTFVDGESRRIGHRPDDTGWCGGLPERGVSPSGGGQPRTARR